LHRVNWKGVMSPIPGGVSGRAKSSPGPTSGGLTARICGSGADMSANFTRCTGIEHKNEIRHETRSESIDNIFIINNLKNKHSEDAKIPYVPFGVDLTSPSLSKEALIASRPASGATGSTAAGETFRGAGDVFFLVRALVFRHLRHYEAERTGFIRQS
jgi:hypothetical protein